MLTRRNVLAGLSATAAALAASRIAEAQQMSVVPFRGLYKPPGTPKFNTRSRFAPGMQNCFVFDASGPIDLLNAGQKFTRTAPQSLGIIKAGAGRKYNGTTSVDTLGVSLIGSQSIFSQLAFFAPFGTWTTFSRFVGNGSSSSTSPFCDFMANGIDSTAAQWFLRDNASNIVTNTAATGTLVAGVPLVLGASVVLASSGGSQIFYLNGKQVAAAAQVTNTTFAGNTTTFGAVNNNGSNIGFGGCVMLLYMTWNRLLSAIEQAELAQDPTNVLVYPDDELFAMMTGIPAVPVVPVGVGMPAVPF